MSTVKQVQQDGQTVDWLMDVKHNSSLNDCFNAVLTFDIPDGVRLTGPSNQGSTVINVPKGYYNITEKKWYIGLLKANEIIPWSFLFTVDDITMVDANDGVFTITTTLTTSCPEANVGNNINILVIQVTDPCTLISISIGSSAEQGSCADISIG